MHDLGSYGEMMVRHDLNEILTDKPGRIYDSPLPDSTFHEKTLQKSRNPDLVAHAVII